MTREQRENLLAACKTQSSWSSWTHAVARTLTASPIQWSPADLEPVTQERVQARLEWCLRVLSEDPEATRAAIGGVVVTLVDETSATIDFLLRQEVRLK